MKKKPLEYLHLSGGIPSVAMALMAAKGLLGRVPTTAIFIETQPQFERLGHYIDYLSLVISKQTFPFPVLTVEGPGAKSASNSLHHYKNGKFQKGYCAQRLKMSPLVHEITSKADLSRKIFLWIGITRDEVIRMRGPRHQSIEPWYPFIDHMPKSWYDLKCFIEGSGVRLPPVPAACPFCPFMGEFERAPLTLKERAQGNLFEEEFQRERGEEFSLITREEGSQVAHFGNECEGMCNT